MAFRSQPCTFPGTLEGTADLDCPIQQYLTDGQPDVDAIWRLVFKGAVRFQSLKTSVILNAQSWCPFNSQSTLFFPDAFPLLYLPATAGFRLTDIWRSFVAQIVLTEHHFHVAFHGPTVYQTRNPHDLMQDFADETPGYLHNDRIMSILSQAVRQKKPADSIAQTARILWQALVEAGFLDSRELALFDAWTNLLAGDS